MTKPATDAQRNAQNDVLETAILNTELSLAQRIQAVRDLDLLWEYTDDGDADEYAVHDFCSNKGYCWKCGTLLTNQCDCS